VRHAGSEHGRDEDLTVVDPKGDRRSTRVTTVPSPAELSQEPDVIVFAVKLYDLAGALESCRMWPRATAVTVQNGIGAEQMAASARPDAALIAASLTAAVEWRDDGALAWLRPGGLGLAIVQGDGEPLATDLAAAFGSSGLRTRLLPDAEAMKWSKLLGNLVANATAAILDMDVGSIYRHHALFEVERDQLREALAVMKTLGVEPVGLPGADVRMLIRALSLPNLLSRRVLAQVLGGARGGKDPSLLIHARTRGGPSEVDWMNGAVVRAGETLGVPTPINAALTRLVNEVTGDRDRREWFRQRPERLLAEL
jgi:2-dehydropantoate 2-reductase